MIPAAGEGTAATAPNPDCRTEDETMAEILHRITIDACVHDVFAAIATDEGIKHWWTDDSTSASAAGEVSEFRFMNGEIVFRMRLNAYEPGSRLVWSFLGDYPAWDGTEVAWHLAPTDDGKTTLNLVHSGWTSTETEYPQCNTSWGHLMHLIRDYVEAKVGAPPASEQSS